MTHSTIEHQAQWYMLEIPALRRQKLEDQKSVVIVLSEFEARLVYMSL